MIPIPLVNAIGFRTLLVVACIGLAGTIAAGVLGYVKGHEAGYDELKVDWDKQQIRQQADYAQRWRDQADEIKRLSAELQKRDAKHEQATLDNERRSAAVIAGLQQRATRAERAAVPASGAAGAAPACGTGAGLCREDSEFLVREFARANQLRADLERCQGAEPVTDGGRMDH